MADAAGNWCLIESDPGVFSELVRGIGVRGVQLEELYDVSVESLAQLAPVHGLIFLFKWDQTVTAQPSQQMMYDVPGMFFARQVIQNACATQAILNVLLNCPQVDLGSELSAFKEFAGQLPSEMRGLAISNSENIRLVHNSFARPEMFSMESRTATEDDDLYHFIGYVPFNGRLYELDGLNEGPVDHGDCGTDWLTAASSVIQSRIDRYAQSEIRFNLMALVGDRLSMAQASARETEAQIAEAEAAASEEGASVVAALQAELGRAQEDIRTEEERRERYRVENVRRKHNYIPFFLEMLRVLAKNGQLQSLAERAKVKSRERAQKRAEKKKSLK